MTAVVATMTAFRLLDWGRPAQFVEVPVPTPAEDEVLVAVAAIGLCHTDVHLMAAGAGTFGFDVPFTLGHETAGHVAAVGAGVTDIDVGTSVVASAHRWCGRCTYCLQGKDNLCLAYRGGPGYGTDGGLAQYVVLPRNCLVGLGDLDPCAAAPLADAGATSYHAVEASRPFLRPGSPAVVIGAGGLGGYAIQFLRLAGTAPIVAVDVSPRRLAGARDLGADATVDGTADTSDVVDEVVRAGGGAAGAAVVFDFVASEATLATATRLASAGGAVVIVGSGHGAVSVGWGRTPPECHVFTCLGNTLCDLRDVLSLASAGRIRLPYRRIAFSEVVDGYQQIESGEADGRIVVGMSTAGGGT